MTTSPGQSGLGRLASTVEAGLVGLPLGLPSYAVELLSRFGGEALSLLRSAQRDGAENRLRGLLSASRYGARGLRFGRHVVFRGEQQVRLGHNVALADGVVLNATGSQGRIEIGDDTHVDVGTVLYGQGGLRIGRGCAIAAGVVVYSQSNQYQQDPAGPILPQGTVYAPVVIGDDVWIGASVVILPGVRIADHAVIGAGSVVTRDVEPWQIVAGVPARPLKDRRDDAT